MMRCECNGTMRWRDVTTQVVRAIDLQKDDAEVAIKIIKARTPYAIQAKREIEVT